MPKKGSLVPTPIVLLTEDLRHDTTSTWSAVQRVNHPARLFLFGGAIVWLTGNPGVEMLPVNALRLRRFATDQIQFEKNKSTGDEGEIRVPASPPMGLFENMLAGPAPQLHRLQGIVRVPVFTTEGFIINRGYSACSGLYYDPDPGLEIPEVPDDPTAHDIELAKDLLLNELLGDFPFPEDSDKAHAIGALLLPFVRPLIDGPTPLHLIMKPQAGTGASLLARVLAGVSCKPNLIHPPEEEAEQERAIFAVLRESPGAIILDNVVRLDARGLASMLTEVEVHHRIIGSSVIGKAVNRATWLANGNNPTLSDEMTRRSVPIRLDAKSEHPEDRTGFKHSDLEGWAAREMKPRLIWAALTIIQYWYRAGKPLSKKTFGGFESWAQTIGGILECVKIEGFLENREWFRNRVDRDTMAFRHFVDAWAEQHDEKEVTVGQLMGLASDLDLGNKSTHSRSVRLGKLLEARQDQRFGSWVIKRCPALVNGNRHWRLQKIVGEVDVVDRG